jgi:hypothetical protein
MRKMLLLLGLALVGCGDGGTGPVAAMIGMAGGSLRAADGTAVDFPVGALSTPTPVKITPTAMTASAAVGPAYLLEPEGTIFAVPVTVTLSISLADLPMGRTAADVVILTAPAGGDTFTSLGGSLVDASHVRATTTHFSVFVPGLLPAASAPDGGTGNVDASSGTDAAPGIGTPCTSNGNCGPAQICKNGLCAPANG